MARRRRQTRSFLLAIAAAGVLASAAYAYTAANTVPATRAGAGSGAVSGYTVSNVGYTLDPTTPTSIDAVAFTLSPATGTVKVQLVPSGAWYACTNSAGSVSCATTSPQATVLTATQLTVVAAQ